MLKKWKYYFFITVLGASYAFFIFIIRGDYKSLQQQFSKVPLLSSLIYERNRTSYKGKIKRLRHISPSFEGLSQSLLSPKKGNPRQYDDYVKFYKNVLALFPDTKQANALLGFCAYYSDNHDEAITYFLESANNPPITFWPYYNLGVIYFESGDYEQALRFLAKARRADANITYNTVVQSKLYNQIFWPKKIGESPFFKESLQKRYRTSAILLAESLQRMGREKEAEVLLKNVAETYKIHLPINLNREDYLVRIF